MRLAINFDLRNPAEWHRPTHEVYAEMMALIEFADSVGIDIISVSEHHRWGDGYISQPLTFLSAAAMRTSRARLMTGVLLLPLYDPVHVAEQATVVDCLSGGRLELAFGAGYRRPEFEIFGLDLADRYRRFERGVQVIRETWADPRFQPAPAQTNIPLWAGLAGPKSARLAGTLGMGLYALQPAAWEPYLAGWQSQADRPGAPSLAGTLALMLADETEKATAQLSGRIVDHFTAYDRYAIEGTGVPNQPIISAADRMSRGAFPWPQVSHDEGSLSERTKWPALGFSILRPQEAAEKILRLTAGRPIDHVKLMATIGSYSGTLAYRNIELIATELKPLLEAGTRQTEGPL